MDESEAVSSTPDAKTTEDEWQMRNRIKKGKIFQRLAIAVFPVCRSLPWPRNQESLVESLIDQEDKQKEIPIRKAISQQASKRERVV